MQYVNGNGSQLGRFGKALSFKLRPFGGVFSKDLGVWLIPDDQAAAAASSVAGFPGCTLDELPEDLAADVAAKPEAKPAKTEAKAAPVAPAPKAEPSKSGDFIVAGETGRFCRALSYTLRPLGAVFDKDRKVWVIPAAAKAQAEAVVAGFPGLSLKADKGTAAKAPAKAKAKTATKTAPKAAQVAAAAKPVKVQVRTMVLEIKVQGGKVVGPVVVRHEGARNVAAGCN